MKLNSKQRSFLKQQAHDLTAVVRIGKDGLTDNIIENIENAIRVKELIKVKALQNAELSKQELREIAEKISKKSEIEIVDIIGKTIIFFKENEKKPVYSDKIKKI
ncbi:RNA-binding protein [Hypnocyclicus thermotrophus]|uniref:RNA-binding protein n=1 Tax=Hypnocyclicus thermotrophus TaxID=1627895 RepID=A0AA46DY55_9FUSO|nr:ribosome assembly RNA-binding protein YhbY [Hypnocyclicus thermotrophus]TDT69761.1 RNA-binding protein [Hypnocyclicus thermotrophus]